MRLALYQPDIPPNVGTMLRMAACFGVQVDVIEPCGFPFDDRRLKRAGMDYMHHVDLCRHASWQRFAASPTIERMVLLTTQGDLRYTDFRFQATDTLLVGRESGGVPAEIHAAADARLRIPLKPGLRSMNVAVAAAIVLGEALRQTGSFPIES